MPDGVEVALLPCWVSERSPGRRAVVLPRFAVLAATRIGSGQAASRGMAEATARPSEMEGYLRTKVRTIDGRVLWISRQEAWKGRSTDRL